MTVDHSIDYSFAGKGAKHRQRRERLTMQSIPKQIAKPKAYAQKPEHEARKKKRENMSDAYYKASGLKARVRLLVVDHDLSFLDLMDILKREGVPLSGVAAGNLRSEMREIMKLLESVGLLNVEAMARRRKKIKAGEAV
jgi:hypothetical protein